ncbi:ABC-F family ATP-binding cassette domain-containing protein [Gemelliphila asaccharolytica]|uniref:ABC transporter, ATP-binding protein n=1 Tax=Gemelliphila asaccharolytica TaxID=502393 RepID=A0ABR5TNJ8_9BACL|nr:ABC-F family ATP-binding cassette domain-containing protein [Gemella asaccharolytica]KXB58997.1 ABC transporter, ATP-binding protein [Gemella asaccharolytica]
MEIYKVENLTKYCGEKLLFNKISFSVKEKEKIGLIGINGAGKSTLLKCIAKKDDYDDGEIIHSNNFEVSYLSQEINLDEKLTVLDTIFKSNSKIMKLIYNYEKILFEIEKNNNSILQDKLLNIQEKIEKENAWEATTIAKTVLSKLGIRKYNTKIKELSGGEKKRVLLAKVLIETPDLLLLDEPTNHLDFKTIEWLEKYLKNYPKSLIVVTHDRYFLDNITNNIIELDKGNIYQYEGNYSKFLEEKTKREEEQQNKYHKNLRLYKKELEWIRAGVKARTTKQQARIKEFENLKTKIDKKEIKKEIKIDLDSSRLGKQVLEFSNISKKYEEKKILENFNLIVQNKDRIGIIGENGVGKTTFLNMIIGKEKQDSGIIKIGQTAKIAYYNQLIPDMDRDIRIIDYLREVAEQIKREEKSNISLFQILEDFLFEKSDHGKKLSKLSGGEKKRLYLLKLLMSRPNILLLDEPTNDLDTQTLTILETYLKKFTGAVIVVSHDRYFLDKVINKLLIFEGQGNVKKYIGSYTEYFDTKQELVKEDVKKEEKKQNKREKKGLTYLEKKEFESLEKNIEEIEEKLKKIQEEMIKNSTNFEKLRELTEIEKILKDKLEKLNDRWEYLAEKI